MPLQYEKRIMRVLTYMHENLAEDLSLDQLAEVAAMSRFHWHRVFHAMTGETCAQSVRRLKMFRAACRLVCKDWPVAKIASLVGYANVNSFSRAFNDEMGASPVLFRKRGTLVPQMKPKPKGKQTMFDIKIQVVSPRRLAALEHKGDYSKVGSCFEKLSEMASSTNLWPQTHGMVGVYYHDPNVVAEKDLRCHAGLMLNEGADAPAGLEEVSLIGGMHAVLSYKGPYDSIAVAYNHLFGNWLPESGREPADAPCYDVYLNDPADTEPSELLTEIYLPLVA